MASNYSWRLRLERIVGGKRRLKATVTSIAVCNWDIHGSGVDGFVGWLLLFECINMSDFAYSPLVNLPGPFSLCFLSFLVNTGDKWVAPGGCNKYYPG